MRAAVLGTGLIGGSVALAARTWLPDWHVSGYDPDPAARAGALERGAVHDAFDDPATAVAGADVVFIAIPVDRIPRACDVLSGMVSESAVVTDVGSAKGEVVARGEAALGTRFVGGHPMAGSERHGIEAADARLFEDAWWVLTPTANTTADAYSTVADFVTRVRAKPVAMAPDAHDTLVASLSHVPQLAASALVGVAVAAEDKDTLLGLAGRGFRDVTRIAASPPDMWISILKTNRDAVLKALEGFEHRLSDIEAMVYEQRWDELRGLLDEARSARLELFAKPDYGGDPVALSLLIPDRPGVLAEVTTAAGRLGANIEDLRIIHSTEGGRGRLELVVTGSTAADGLSAALDALDYRVDRGVPEQ
ncbi:MAG: prephenate dehydrogenase [Actinomycetota bacterium]|nr:prephenate dehydrogenase [Actinomycetota bacterium]